MNNNLQALQMACRVIESGESSDMYCKNGNKNAGMIPVGSENSLYQHEKKLTGSVSTCDTVLERDCKNMLVHEIYVPTSSIEPSNIGKNLLSNCASQQGICQFRTIRGNSNGGICELMNPKSPKVSNSRSYRTQGSVVHVLEGQSSPTSVWESGIPLDESDTNIKTRNPKSTSLTPLKGIVPSLVPQLDKKYSIVPITETLKSRNSTNESVILNLDTNTCNIVSLQTSANPAQICKPTGWRKPPIVGQNVNPIDRKNAIQATERNNTRQRIRHALEEQCKDENVDSLVGILAAMEEELLHMKTSSKKHYNSQANALCNAIIGELDNL